MELQEIEVVIGKDGQVQIQVRGVQGLKCLEITKELEDALGGEILARIMTPEALEQENQQTDADQDQHLKASH
jgi:DNA-binding protein YbaB